MYWDGRYKNGSLQAAGTPETVASRARRTRHVVLGSTSLPSALGPARPSSRRPRQYARRSRYWPEPAGGCTGDGVDLVRFRRPATAADTAVSKAWAEASKE